MYLIARSIEPSADQWSPFQADVAQLIEQWTDDTPQIAVFGPFSSGKTTLINQLFGKHTLPTNLPPTTAVVTSVRFGDHPRGVLKYRTSTKLTIASSIDQKPDSMLLEALSAWVTAPGEYGVASFRELDELGRSKEIGDLGKLLADLRALQTNGTAVENRPESDDGERIPYRPLQSKISRRKAGSASSFFRTFEVKFHDQEPEDIDLSSDEGARMFGLHLTKPSLASRVQKACCYCPNPHLRSFNLLDTAGLCSPIKSHKDITIELLQRRPDKILVLLDSRRLDSPTNRTALSALSMFVTTPEDYRHVIFALTFWDSALRTYMMEDSEPELDFSSAEQRKAASRDYKNRKCRELKVLLSSSVGVSCPQPRVYTLGLSENPPLEMRGTIEDLWRFLAKECGGWIGIEMWAERWRAASEHATQLREIYQEHLAVLETAIEREGVNADLKVASSRVKAQQTQVKRAFARSVKSLDDIIETQKKVMLAEIQNLNIDSGLDDYLESGYSKSANAALAEIKKESRRQNAVLASLYKNVKGLHIVSLDKKIIGLGGDEKEEAIKEVSGFLYFVKSAVDLFIRGFKELRQKNRDKVAKLLRDQVEDIFDAFEDAAEKWKYKAKLAQDQELADLQNEVQSIAIRSNDATKRVKELQENLSFLKRFESPVEDLEVEVRQFAQDLIAEQGSLD